MPAELVCAPPVPHHARRTHLHITAAPSICWRNGLLGHCKHSTRQVKSSSISRQCSSSTCWHVAPPRLACGSEHMSSAHHGRLHHQPNRHLLIVASSKTNHAASAATGGRLHSNSSRHIPFASSSCAPLAVIAGRIHTAVDAGTIGKLTMVLALMLRAAVCSHLIISRGHLTSVASVPRLLISVPGIQAGAIIKPRSTSLHGCPWIPSVLLMGATYLAHSPV